MEQKFNLLTCLQYGFQSIQYHPENIDDFIADVQFSWEDRAVKKVKINFLALQNASETSM